MAIKVQWGPEGPFAVCDTATEAAELLRQGASAMNGITALPKNTQAHSSGQAVSEKAGSVLAGLNDKTKQLLKALAANPNGIEAGELGRASGIKVAAFGGFLGAVSKQAKKSGFALDRLVSSEVRFNGQERSRWLSPGKLLIDNKDRLA